MSAKIAALISVVGAAAAGLWIQKKKRDLPSSAGQRAHGMMMIDIDDDTAADIIRRARPALERARTVASELPAAG